MPKPRAMVGLPQVAALAVALAATTALWWWITGVAERSRIRRRTRVRMWGTAKRPRGAMPGALSDTTGSIMSWNDNALDDWSMENRLYQFGIPLVWAGGVVWGARKWLARRVAPGFDERSSPPEPPERKVDTKESLSAFARMWAALDERDAISDADDDHADDDEDHDDDEARDEALESERTDPA